MNPTYTPLPISKTGYSSFNQFYPYYLGEHNNKVCRRLHLVGTTGSIASLVYVLASGLSKLDLVKRSTSQDLTLRLPYGLAWWQMIGAGILQGYFFAWVGHFFFEKNKPATFKHPIYSFMGDLRLWFEAVTFQRSV